MKVNLWCSLNMQKMVGSLIYLMNCTIPDITFAVGKLSESTLNPNNEHRKERNRILRYHKGTINYGLQCLVLVLFGMLYDANWASDKVD